MIDKFYVGQKLHLLEYPNVQMKVYKLEDNTICVHRWRDDYTPVKECYTDLEGTKKLLGEGWNVEKLELIQKNTQTMLSDFYQLVKQAEKKIEKYEKALQDILDIADGERYNDKVLQIEIIADKVLEESK
jgi:hypothetical protein